MFTYLQVSKKCEELEVASDYLNFFFSLKFYWVLDLKILVAALHGALQDFPFFFFEKFGFSMVLQD